MSDMFFAVAVVVFLITVVYFTSRDFKKYKVNMPYKPKKRKPFFQRILLSLKAGFHYVHYIETYDHKKYNTQVFTPVTLECYLAGFFAFVLVILYFVIAYYLRLLIGDFGFLILLAPIISNLISIFSKKE